MITIFYLFMHLTWVSWTYGISGWFKPLFMSCLSLIVIALAFGISMLQAIDYNLPL